MLTQKCPLKVFQINQLAEAESKTDKDCLHCKAVHFDIPDDVFGIGKFPLLVYFLSSLTPKGSILVNHHEIAICV